MTYSETVAWMFSRLPMFQRQGASAYRKDLTNIRKLATHLGEPQQKFKSIHVAGTNGKGSTSHMLASIFMASGYRCGLYTSPHLTDFRERIRIDGKMIPEKHVVHFIEQHKVFFEANDLSFFEMTVGLAFDYFACEKVDIAIIETGMGGRLDATNIITPELSVITNIGLDHTQFLGDTLSAIATEKAGIIKNRIPVVVGEVTPETRPIFEQTAAHLGSPLYFASPAPVMECDLKGTYQQKNIATAVTAAKVLMNSGWKINNETISDGIHHVALNTGLQGRWQQLGTDPLTIADTAHNAHGLRATLPQLMQISCTRLHIVLGTVSDKNLEEILPLFPQKAHYYFCKPDIPRGMDVSVLKKTALDYGLQGEAYPSVAAAYLAAKQAASPSDCIFIGGSTFVVAEIL